MHFRELAIFLDSYGFKMILYAKGGQSVALQLIFAAIGPFLLFGKAVCIVY